VPQTSLISSSPPPSPLGASACTIRVHDAAEWGKVEARWSELFAASGSCSFFLSPEWVGTWLEVFGRSLNAEVVFFERAGVTVGAVVLTRRISRRGLVPLRQLFCHTAGEPGASGVAAEDAGPLCRPEHAEAVFRALRSHVGARNWDEFVLSGVREHCFQRLVNGISHDHVETEWRPTYTVDLARVRAQGSTYEAALSRNTRHQIRRSVRLYRARGELVLQFATTTTEALAMLAELATLHQMRWKAMGRAGAFASRPWRTFHERLVTRAFSRGAVQLVRLRVGDTTVGVVYNYVQTNTAEFYQSGFRYEADNRFKPGLVTHALVIQACLERGLDVYDFLASDAAGSRYKQSLSTDTAKLAWVVMRRDTARTRVFVGLRRIRRMWTQSAS
jgi:CelD/BcsL family acetyltransferase involved in cellulose biosynthesis